MTLDELSLVRKLATAAWNAGVLAEREYGSESDYKKVEETRKSLLREIEDRACPHHQWSELSKSSSIRECLVCRSRRVLSSN